MWSVPRRRRLFSTSFAIQTRELPSSLRPGPIWPCTLVARMTSSRRPLSALPTISSDSPAEYTSAVSTKLIPPSIAARIVPMQSSTSVLPHSPNIIVPRQCVLTLRPVPPSVLYSIGRTYHRAQIRSARGSSASMARTRAGASEPEEGRMEFDHDSLMGLILVAAGVLTFLYTRNPTNTMKLLALLGALGSVIIGALLFLQLASRARSPTLFALA